MRTRPLAELSSRELRPLLQEEAELWRTELLWDFTEVSSAVAGGLDRGTLGGLVLQDAWRPIAYCYSMPESGRTIVGSLFASGEFRGRGLEEDLLEAVLTQALDQPENDRVECQTLFSTAQQSDTRFARSGFRSRGRHYLLRSLEEPIPVPRAGSRLRPLRRDEIPSAAQLIFESHLGSLDAALNLTYASPDHCRHFVETVVLRSGCGRFDPAASFVIDGRGGPEGVIVASRLSRTNGHICQVSVRPPAQGQGLGEALLLASLQAFRRQGLAVASLSVTVGNEIAYRMYERLGFRLRKAFAAHAWVRPPARIELPA